MKAYHKPKDAALFLIPVGIFFVGLFFIYSASWREGTPLDQTLVVRQSCWMLFAMLLTLISLRFHYRRLLDVAWPLYWVVILLLVAVLFTPAQGGAHRWFKIGFINLQPSELAKFAVIVALAAYMKERRFQYVGFKDILFTFAIVGLPLVLIMKEPDLGTGLIFVPVFIGMIYVWGFRLKWIISMMLLGILSSPVLFFFLKDYQKSRLMVYLNPTNDPLGAGYTIIQSKIAIGSGGLLGKGFLSGSQTQLQFLPEKHTDFIFSVIGEEGGFLAMSIIIISYWLIIYKGFYIARHCQNRFGKYLATGITTLLAFQAIINMAMTMGLMPVVGMPLLLVSYGGSSLIITMLLIGVLINIGMRRDAFL